MLWLVSSEPRVIDTGGHTCSAHSSGSSDSVGAQSDLSFCSFWIKLINEAGQCCSCRVSYACRYLVSPIKEELQHQRLSSNTDALSSLIRRARKRDAENPDPSLCVESTFLDSTIYTTLVLYLDISNNSNNASVPTYPTSRKSDYQ